MGIADDGLMRLLDLLYAGVADSSRMVEFLGALGEIFGAHTCVIQIHDAYHAAGELVVSAGALAMGSLEVRAYGDRYAKENVWMQLGTSRLRAQGIVTGAEVVDPARLAMTEFHDGFLRPLDIHDSLATLLMDDGHGVALLTMNRSRHQGLFGDPERDLLRHLSGHLRNAYALQRRLSWLDLERQQLRSSVDRLPFGVMLLDAGGRVCVVNRAADALFAHRVDAGTRIGQITQLDPASRRRLADAVALAAASARTAPHPRKLHLGHAKRPGMGMLAVVVPLHDAVFGDLDMAHCRVALFLHPLQRTLQPGDDDHWLADAFELSPAQVRLARLVCQGLDLDQCAATLNNSIHTVRTQLKAIYAKVGVHRQAELVAMLGALLGG